MLPTVARIFVSSTWLDLQPERHAAEAIHGHGIGELLVGRVIGHCIDQRRLDKGDRINHPLQYPYDVGVARDDPRSQSAQALA